MTASVKNATVAGGDYARLVYSVRTGLGANVSDGQAIIERALSLAGTMFRAGPVSGGVDAGSADVTGIQGAQVVDVRVRATADAARYGSWLDAARADGLDTLGSFLSVQGDVALLDIVADAPADPPGLASTAVAKTVKATATPTIASALTAANTTVQWVALAAVVLGVGYLVYRLAPRRAPGAA